MLDWPVAEIVWLPAVLKVPVKTPTPLVKELLDGSAALASVLVNWTGPL